MYKLTKSELSLAKKIGKEHYVKLKTEARCAAGRRLADLGLARLYEKDGSLWAKALSLQALEELRALE